MNTLRILIGAALALSSLELAHAGELGLKELPVVQNPGLPGTVATTPIKPIIGRVGAGGWQVLGGGTAPTYTFTLKSFRIANTRSLFTDTDYVSVAIAIGNNPPMTLPAKAVGNLDEGTYQVNLTIPNVAVASNQAVAFSYGIVNSGFNQNSLEQALIKYIGAAADKAAQAGAAALGGLVGGPAGTQIGSAVGATAGSWAVGKLLNVIFADCDGSVAAGDHVFSGAQLAAQTTGGRLISATDYNAGTNSPNGCGSNSKYYVTWSINAGGLLPTAGGGGLGGPISSGGGRKLN